MRVPKEIETKIVTRLYADANTLDWDHLTPQQHSAQYTKWVSDPKVGGRLQNYVSGGDARVWIKDGPMKEWARAKMGVGKFAPLIEGSAAIPAKLIKKVLGEGWELVPGTMSDKPLRLTATNEDEDEVVVSWAPSSGLKHMVWAALSANAKGDVRTWVLCIVGTFTKQTPANEQQAQQRIAKRCGLRLKHVIL